MDRLALIMGSDEDRPKILNVDEQHALVDHQMADLVAKDARPMDIARAVGLVPNTIKTATRHNDRNRPPRGTPGATVSEPQ